jgi:predicted dehydrogenase
MTPNDTHRDYAVAALERGFDVICDKPMANTAEEAADVLAAVRDSDLVYCLTHNYTGYPMVRQARAMVADGQLGVVRLVQVEYVQGGKANEDDPDPSDGLPWRYDPVRGGPSLVMGDIGTHAHNLVRFISGLEVAEVAAEIGTIVPNRLVHDYGGAMLRFDNGARGSFWVTQAAAGVENCLRVRVSGTKGSVEWAQELPTQLWFRPLDRPAELRTPNGPGTLALSARASRIVKGHPRASMRASPPSTRTRPRQSLPVAPASRPTRWPRTSQMPRTACGASSSSRPPWPRVRATGRGRASPSYRWRPKLLWRRSPALVHMRLDQAIVDLANRGHRLV